MLGRIRREWKEGGMNVQMKKRGKNESKEEGKTRILLEEKLVANWLDMVQCCDMLACLIDWTFTNLSAVPSSW
jgi:hypothetical protein